MTAKEEGNDISQSPFRLAFKYYKGRRSKPDFSQVIDFRSLDITNAKAEVSNNAVKVLPVTLQTPSHSGTQCRFLGLKAVSQWQAYSIEGFPGFIFISNPFLSIGQQYWIHRCLKDYHCWPNNNNLGAHVSLEPSCNIWDLSHYCSDSVVNDRKNIKNNKSFLIDRLRWATLGYQYEWTSKQYYDQKNCSFPEDLACLSKLMASVIGFPEFTAEAAIINYYKLDSTLNGHTDHSEYDLTAPLLSFSFGQTALFLLGGKTLIESPIAIYVRSGDVCILSGESRLAYHAIPRIIKEKMDSYCWQNSTMDFSDGQVVDIDNSKCVDCRGSCASFTSPEAILKSDDSIANNAIGDSIQLTTDAILAFGSPYITKKCLNCITKSWTSYKHYLEESRINMNVRQVLGAGQKFPT